MKKARRIRSELDKCHYYGDVSKCATCQQVPQTVRDAWGEEYQVLTICQLYARAGMGPTGRRHRIIVMALAALAGLSLPLIVRWLT